jgi:hypothetical protein
MKRIFWTAALMTLSATARAEPGFMIGVSHNFGGSTGVTFKILSTNEKDKPLVAAGFTYYPWSEVKTWGFDTGVGYSWRNGAVVLGYDWLNEQMQLDRKSVV